MNRAGASQVRARRKRRSLSMACTSELKIPRREAREHCCCCWLEFKNEARSCERVKIGRERAHTHTHAVGGACRGGGRIRAKVKGEGRTHGIARRWILLASWRHGIRKQTTSDERRRQSQLKSPRHSSLPGNVMLTQFKTTRSRLNAN